MCYRSAGAFLTGMAAITLPTEIRSDAAWYGGDLAAKDDWIERLSSTEIDEVERAVHEIEKSKLSTLCTNDVPLPTLAPRLKRLLDEVLNGRGFVLIKGLPLHRWTRQEAAIAFLAVGVHL